MGMGAGKVGINYIGVDLKEQPPVKVHREAIEIFRKVVKGEPFGYEGEMFTSAMPGIPRAPLSPRYIPVVYRRDRAVHAEACRRDRRRPDAARPDIARLCENVA